MSNLPPELARKIRDNTEVYGECEVTLYTNCTVQGLRNSVTGEISVGWERTENTEEINE